MSFDHFECLISSVENKTFVCKTCKCYLQKLSIPPECTLNGFKYDCIADEISDLTFLEEHLVALRVPFTTILERPNGGQLSCRGGIVNVPNSVNETINVIPRNWRVSELLCVDLKRRIADKFPYMNAYIRPAAVHSAAKRLVSTNLYKDRGILYDSSWSVDGIEDVHKFLIQPEEQGAVDPDAITEEANGCSDTLVCQHTVEPGVDQKLVLAPTENNAPVSLFTDESSEELA